VPHAGLERRLVDVVRGSALLMTALRAARDVDPPDWLVGGGAVRDLVWDHLHAAKPIAAHWPLVRVVHAHEGV
jgi:hypothetical protein